MYMIGSQYYHLPGTNWAPYFLRLWFDNLRKYSDPMPKRVVVLSHDNLPVRHPLIEVIRLSGNLGHADDLLQGRKPWWAPACPCGWMMLMWMAYLCECDFISREQDVIAVGPYIRAMYDQLGHKGAIFGPSKMHGTSTSLFLIRHHAIPTFALHYLQAGPETHLNRIAEHKIHRMIEQWPEHFCRFNFGTDKDRNDDGTLDPAVMDQPVFWLQQTNRKELLELERRGFIKTDGMPTGVEHFFNYRPLPK
jgi:hypothetical protein